MKDSSRELYKAAIVKFGKPSQIEMLIEELSELTLAVQKFKRAPSRETADQVCDEMADVEIMLEQNRLLFSENLVERRKEVKLERLSKTLSSDLYSKYSMDSEMIDIASGDKD